MTDLARRSYSAGWVPDADAVNAPKEALLRADNLVLDELGVLALRPGVTALFSGVPLSELDINALFTVVRSGTILRYAGAGNQAYRNAVTPLGPTFNGTGDIQFGSHMGQTLIARGSTKVKDDGSSVRNWGIEMTGGVATVSGPITTDSKDFATWDIAETADHTIEEDDGAGLDYDEGHDGTADGAIVLVPNSASGRGVVKRTFALDTDFSILDGGREMTADDIVTVYMYTVNPLLVLKIIMIIDVNEATFKDDYYRKEWPGEGFSGYDGTIEGGGFSGSGGDPNTIPDHNPLI